MVKKRKAKKTKIKRKRTAKKNKPERARMKGRGESRGRLSNMLRCTARPIASLGSRFLPLGSASSRTSLCGFMLLSGAKLVRGQLILYLLPSRRWATFELPILSEPPSNARLFFVVAVPRLPKKNPCSCSCYGMH